MRTIICKKCGAAIDASLGECPNCGAVYYILPEEERQAPAEKEFYSLNDTLSGREAAMQEREKLSSELASAQKDDIFATGVWHTFEDPDATRPFAPQPPREQQAPPQWQPQNPQRQAQRQAAERQAQAQRQAAARRDDLYDDDDYYDYGDRRYGSSGRKTDPGKKHMILAGVALLAVLTLVITIMSGALNFNKNKGMEMPYVVGMSGDMAKDHLEGLGLVVNTQKDHSDRPEGEVIAQSIRDGRSIKKGDKVMLTVSSGPDEDSDDEIEYVRTPYLLGKSYDRALRELQSEGLLLARGEDQFSDKPAGEVISQSPTEGTELKKGDMVTVILSKGPEPSPSPTGWKITVTSGSGGTVSPKGVVSVEDGKDCVFTITPNEGYEVGEVKVDGTSIGQVTGYTFTRVSSDHTIYVIFRVKPTPTPETPTPPVETQTQPTQAPPDGGQTADQQQ